MKTPTPGYEFFIAKDQLTHFRKLLEQDTVENLIARYNYFLEVDPALLKRRMGFVPLIYEYYWTCIEIKPQGQDEIPFAYSIGFFYEYHHPEVMLIGGDLDSDRYRFLINEMGCHIRDEEPLVTGKDYTERFLLSPTLELEDEGDDKLHLHQPHREETLFHLKAPLIFREYDLGIEKQFPCGYLYSFYRNFADMGDNRPPILVSDLR